VKKHLLGLAIFLAANTGHAHDEADCRGISNLLARLSCYDESHAFPSFELRNKGRDQKISLTSSRNQGDYDH
jgi:hypothetical protein